MRENQSPRTSMVVWAAIGTLLLAIAGIALVSLHLLDRARGRHIEDAVQPSLISTSVAAVAFVIAAGWAIWLVRHRGHRDVGARIAIILAVALLVSTPVIGWRAFTTGRELTVITSTCDAESLRTTGGDLRAGCSEAAVETMVLLQGVRSDETWIPETTGNLTRAFADLPAGSWDARLTVDGPAETVAVVVNAERDGALVRLGTLRPQVDAESERLRWSGVVPVAQDIARVEVQFYLSANPAVESARIRFEVHSCSGQNPRNFDATLCEPLAANSPFVYEQSPAGTRTWRQLYVTREGDAYVVSNLEARTYTLQPDYIAIENATRSTDVLIIPAAMEQVAALSITAPGEEAFEIEIDASTGELQYVVYVFPTGPTYAHEMVNGEAE